MMGRRSITLLTVLALTLAGAAPAAATTIYAVGDTDASSGSKALANYVIARSPDRFFYLGDVYETGTAAEFQSRYNAIWGTIASRTDPVIGNHEYPNRTLGYFPYWASKRSWSATTAQHRAYVTPEGWQVIAYSSEHSASSEAAWVNARIAEHPGTCRIVMAHKGRHSQPDITGQEAVWKVIKNRTALNLAAHHHLYLRFAKIDGVTVIISGLGGHKPVGLSSTQHHPIAASVTQTPTVLKLNLRAGAADFEARTAAGTLRDSGTVGCTPATTTPVAPVAAFSATPTSGAAPLSVSFKDASTGAPTIWEWDFDGNNTVDSTQQNPSFSYTTPGTYTVRLTARNATGVDDEVKVGLVTVGEAPPPGTEPQTFLAEADAHVRSTSASNYGALTTIRVRQGDASTPDTYNTYVRFSVSGLAGAPSSARLRLFVTDESPNGGSVWTTSSAWAESSITWSTAPGFSGTPLAPGAATVLGAWREVDVTRAISGNGAFAFVLASTSTNSAIYSSREGANPPQLVVTP